ncbi:2-oxoglutarate and iron-dependent oxygenase JMJD4 homolog [Gryllus bimaculatus]|nr:2-oxoglutarate and iron-dependent oxygenase JMJD4 homolog [Gryllus bimaculatus]
MVNNYDTIELENEIEDLSINCSDTQIIRIDKPVSYNTIFKNFLVKNRPCIIKIPSAQSWKSTKEWVSQGLPHFSNLQNIYGTVTVPVADCGEKYYNVQKKQPTQFSEYLSYWEKYIKNGYPSDMPCLYLKDWHFTKDFPTHIIYEVPQYFASDWLNEYLTSRNDINDDYRFVYLGPKGSWTPFHADVFTSFSWSINICGKKRWLLFPPGQEDYLRDNHGNLIYDATCSDMLDNKLFPDHHKLTPYDITQETGEAIFVPTGWHHQVWNLDTISINHNWVNGCNIENMWLSMQKNLNDVKKEIEDCQAMEDWAEHCQIMLQAVFGMNYEEFLKFIGFIAECRLASLKTNCPIVLYGGWKLGKWHTIFDLQKINSVLRSFMTNTDVQALKFYDKSLDSLKHLCMEMEEVLGKFAMES